jgi:hypothetical protein
LLPRVIDKFSAGRKPLAGMSFPDHMRGLGRHFADIAAKKANNPL